MKKLMIAAAIVCAAALSQASTYRWQASIDQVDAIYQDHYDAARYALEGNTAYFFLCANGTDVDTKNAILTALRQAGGNYESVLTGTAGFIGSGPTKGTDSLVISDLIEDFSNGSQMSGFAIILDTAANGDVWAYTATTGSGTGVDSTKTGTGSLKLYGSDSSDTPYDPSLTGMLADDWDSWNMVATAAVPEPTSGLLLLLGVAGLALRRRRA